MRCEICGGEFRPSGHGKRQRYCSESCRNKAKYRRRKNGGTSTPRTKPEPDPVELGRREFERMMDDSLEDVLRMNRALLFGAMMGARTCAPAMEIISDTARSNIPALGYAGTYAIANVLLTLAGTLIVIVWPGLG